MPEPEIPAQLTAAVQRLVDLPGLGAITTDIWEALDLGSFGELLLGSLIDKAELSARDGQMHSFTLLLPTPEGLTTAVCGMTWPGPLSDFREQAKTAFAQNASVFLQQGVAGTLQFDLFLQEANGLELRLAWQPSPTLMDSLPGKLRVAVYPWGATKDAEPAPYVATGADIVDLAEAAWELCQAMAERYRKWPKEDGPPPIEGFMELRAPFRKLVPGFNQAVKRVGLEHTMPVEDFDSTWRPHNIGNALRFGSIPGSLRAELLRVWGSDARDRFAAAWKLLQEASPQRPSQSALDAIAQPPLMRQPEGSATVPPGILDVFISYAWSDKTRGARDVYEMIASSGRSVWLDEEQRVNALRVDDEIAPALLRANAIVICLSTEMLTRAGYALREVLIAVTHMPTRCTLAKLDDVPVPPFLSKIRVVEWYEPNGPNALLAALPAAGAMLPDLPQLSLQELLQTPQIENLVATVKRSTDLKRSFNRRHRHQQLEMRGRLLGDVLDIWHEYYPSDDWSSILALAGKTPNLLAWSALSGHAAKADPTVFGASLRLRSALFRAHVQTGAHQQWETHNHAAYDLLEEMLDADQDLFRPALRIGWLPENCRLAGQDCLDTFRFAYEWFRGWSPDLLVRMCGVPAKSAATVEQRMQQRISWLAETMLALRAFEDGLSPQPLPPTWSDWWIELRRDLLHKLQLGTHPATQAYFQELSRWMTRDRVEQVAIAMADGVLESLSVGHHREEVILDVGPFVLRCVVRCSKAAAGKHETLASVRGSVVKDLKQGSARKADLSILLSTFLHWSDERREWNYIMNLNCLGNPEGPNRATLPGILLNPFLIAEMLSPEELAEIGATAGVYEEVD